MSQSHDPNMMRACGGRFWLSLGSRQKNLVEPRWLHHFPCAWEGWDCGRQVGVPGQPIGRNPTVANSVVESLSRDAAPAEDCLAQLDECGLTMDVRDFDGGPLGPSSAQESDHRMWQRVSLHGWQYWSSSVSDASFRKLTLLSGRTASSRAHLRSQRRRRVGALPHRTGIHHSTSSLQNVVA